jgi:hypothetical protein
MPAKTLGNVADGWGTLMTFASIFGSWPTTAQLEDRLRRIRRADLVLRLAWCNAYTRTWEIVRDNEADRRARNYLFPFWITQFDSWTRQYGEGFLFHRYSLLWLLRHALTFCDPDANSLNTPEQLALFGEACLIANDLAAFESPKTLPTDLAVAANMLPNTEYFSHEDYDRDVARTYYMLTDMAPKAIDERFRRLAARLEELLGFEITAYCDLAFASAMKTLTTDTTTPERFQLQTIAPEHFSTTTIAPANAALFLEKIAADEDALCATIRASNSHNADLTVFRDRPLLRRTGGCVTIDAGFVLDKAGRSLFWTALKNCNDRAERERLLADWGDLFERYVNELLEANLGPESTLLPNPVFGDGAQVCDGIVRERRTLILLEYKASTISNSIKFADNPAVLEAILEERFVTGTDQRRKGLAQLFHAINRFTSGDPVHASTLGTVLKHDEVSTIMPVLVHLDNALRTPGLPHYMKARFKALGRIKTHTITPLTLLPITELEELEGHLTEYPLATLLESFLGQLRADRASVFLTRKLSILQGKYRTAGTTLRRFDQYLDAMQRRLFPNEPQERPVRERL